MRLIHFFLLLVLGGNGLAMLFAPELWYRQVPGVDATGPLNAHFVRDIGAAYLVCGLAFAAVLRHGATARPAAWGACLFLLLHAAIHVVETLSGVHGFAHLLRDLPAVLLLPLLAVWSLRATTPSTHGDRPHA